MKEIKSIIAAYDELKSTDSRFAMATVVHVEDSSYRRSGARMLITEDGNWTGGISGGCLEGDTLKKAQYAIYQNKPTTVRYDTREDDPDQIGVGLGCNGLIDVLITPFDATANHIEKLRRCTKDRQISILITVVEDKSDTLEMGSLWSLSEVNTVAGFNDIISSIEIDVLAVIDDQKSKAVVYQTRSNSIKLFIEFLPPPIQLMIFGKNYDTMPLVKIGKEIGWDICMVANPNKVSKSLFHEVGKTCNVDTALKMIDNYSAALLMSHDFKTDKGHFKKLSATNIPYIGLLGPSKRTDKICSELRTEGLKFQTNNLFAPIGLDTGATTPDEIAISMIAEIRTYFSGRSGGFLRDREGRIND